MNRPRTLRPRSVAGLALTLSAAAVAAAGAAATAPPRVPTAHGPRIKPARLSTADIAPGQFDETTFHANRLRWSHWGATTTTAHGTIQRCIIEYDPCRSYRGRVVLDSLVSSKRCGEDGDSQRVYTRVRFQNPDGSMTPTLRMAAC